MLTISPQPVGRFTPNFACGRTLLISVSSSLLGVSGPQGRKKRGNDIFVTIGVNEEFLHFGGFWAISQQRVGGSTCLPTCLLPLWGPSAPGGGWRRVKDKKWGVVSVVHRTASISIFLSGSKCGSMCRADLRTFWSRSAKAFLQGGPISSQKF